MEGFLIQKGVVIVDTQVLCTDRFDNLSYIQHIFTRFNPARMAWFLEFIRPYVVLERSMRQNAYQALPIYNHLFWQLAKTLRSWISIHSETHMFELQPNDRVESLLLTLPNAFWRVLFPTDQLAEAIRVFQSMLGFQTKQHIVAVLASIMLHWFVDQQPTWAPQWVTPQDPVSQTAEYFTGTRREPFICVTNMIRKTNAVLNSRRQKVEMVSLCQVQQALVCNGVPNACIALAMPKYANRISKYM